MNRGTIHRIELAQVSPRLDTLGLLCRALGTDLKGFFQGMGAEEAQAPGAGPGQPSAPGDLLPTGVGGGFRLGMLDWLVHLEALFHCSADGFAVADRAGRLVFESKVSTRLRGDTPLGRDSRPWFHTAHAEDRPALEAGMAAVLQQPTEPVRLEYRVPEAGGGWRWVRSTLRNQLDHPAIQGIVINTQDITDWRVAEDQRWRIQKLESQLQVVQAMTAEFSNLWMGVQGHLELARIEGVPAGKLAVLRESLLRASRTLHQMRDICGHRVLDRRPLDLNQLIQEAILAPEPGAPGGHELELDPGLPPVVGDRELLARLVTYLIGPLDGQRPALRLSTHRAFLSPQEASDRFRGQGLDQGGEFVVFEVHDPHDAAAGRILPEPFDLPFDEGLSSGRLSLLAASRTARDHGGGVEQLHSPGDGSRIRVCLPLGQEAAREAWKTAGASGGLVLVVDDEEFIRSAICDLLADLGYGTLAARNGQEALELHAGHREGIGLVLLDLNMPLVNGEAVYRELRERDPGLKVVLCTGTANSSLDQGRLFEGVAGILRKPFKFEELRVLVRSLLRG